MKALRNVRISTEPYSTRIVRAMVFRPEIFKVIYTDGLDGRAAAAVKALNRCGGDLDDRIMLANDYGYRFAKSQEG